MSWLWIGLASAGTWVTGAVETDIASGQTLGGVDFAVLGDQDKGVRPVFRVLGGLDVVDLGPSAVTDLGFSVVVPAEEEATIRFGMLARARHLVRNAPISVQFGESDERARRYGVVPAVLLVGELGWTPEAPMTIGAELGAQPWGALREECLGLEEQLLPERCFIWPVSVAAAATFRKRFKSGFSIQASAGTTFRAGIGWGF